MNLTWEIAAAICTIIGLLGTVAVKWIISTVEHEAKARESSAQAILANQVGLKDDLKDLHDNFEKRVDRLEQKSVDYRSGATVDAAIDHAKRNLLMAIDGVKSTGDKNGLANDNLRDRITVLETKHEATAVAVGEVKRELKDTRHELNERFDQMAATQRVQFDQLCVTIREMSDRKPKA